VVAPPSSKLRDSQQRLSSIWQAIKSGRPGIFTSVVIPSLSLDADELTKIAGVPFYEERLLFLLIRLRDPRARVVYVTSQPIHPEIIDYYLHHLVGVSALRARHHATFLCVHDASPRPLTEKILERPRVIERIRQSVADPAAAYLTCYNSTHRERELAEVLGIALNGVDPELLGLGTKSGSRRVFASAGVDRPAGREGVRTAEDVVDGLLELKRERPGLGSAVVKLDESFAGTGNAVFRYPEPWPEDEPGRRSATSAALPRLEWNVPAAAHSFWDKLSASGGVVEELIEAGDLRSPSVQMRIDPGGEVELVSTHDQVLGGASAQTFIGCRFPADAGYRDAIQRAALAVGRELRDRGVISRLGIDFVAWEAPTGGWRTAAIEINLRMGGTTAPFLALQFLTGGDLDRETGRFLSATGREKFYYATDRLASPAYRGLLPEDFVDILETNRLGFRPATETGVLFHMIGALSEHGKVGVTCIGDSRQDADDRYRRTTEVLDRETGEGATEQRQRGGLPQME